MRKATFFLNWGRDAGVLFRVLIRFAAAFYATDSVTAQYCLDRYIVILIETRCAQGLNICNGSASNCIGEQVTTTRNCEATQRSLP
jgi:hypothetical protein